MIIPPQDLIGAYCQGIFPMADPTGRIGWYDPDTRTIIPLDSFHVPRRLARTIRQGEFVVRVDTAFRQVMEACAKSGPGRETTWISPEIIDSYCQLHRLGFAHSVEIWREDQLVGGLYGVSIRGLFAGESMFSQVKDSSKIALVYLVELLRRRGFYLLDTQFMTNHLRRFGAVEISRDEYRQRLAQALAISAEF